MVQLFPPTTASFVEAFSACMGLRGWGDPGFSALEDKSSVRPVTVFVALFHFVDRCTSYGVL